MPRPLLILCAALLACSAEPASTPAAAEPSSSPAAARTPSTPPRLVAAPPGGRVAEIVEAERGGGAGQLVVYVGAAWCEPCVAFHEALLAGQLDADLAGVRFLEFDLDRDRARLEADGYSSRYVPLFALPGRDGRASGAQIEGGTKGPGAARQLVERLLPLLAAAGS
jgi:hypothetical protein